MTTNDDNTESKKLLEITSLCSCLMFNTDRKAKYLAEHNNEYYKKYCSAQDTPKFLDNLAKLLRCKKKNVVAVAPYICPEGKTTLYLAENQKSEDFESFGNSLISLCKEYAAGRIKALADVKRPLLKLVLDRNRGIMTQKMTKDEKLKLLSDEKVTEIRKCLQMEKNKKLVLADWEVRKRENRLKIIDQALLKKHENSDSKNLEEIYPLVVQDYVEFVVEFQKRVSSISDQKKNMVSNHALATASKAAAKLHRSSLYPFINACDETLGKYIRQVATHEIAFETIINCIKKKHFKTLLNSIVAVYVLSDVQRVELPCWKDVARKHGASTEIINHIESESERNGIRRYPQGESPAAVHAELTVIKAIIEKHPTITYMHVSVSKYCCRACDVAIRALNERYGKKLRISVSGTHNKIYKLWVDPGLGVGTAVLSDLTNIWKAYLNNVNSHYRGLLSDSDQEGDLTDDEEVKKGIAEHCLDDPNEEDYD